MAQACKEKRQPICTHCGHPLDRVLQENHQYIAWTWNASGYFQDAVDELDSPYHDCAVCSDRCKVRDSFAGNDLIY